MPVKFDADEFDNALRQFKQPGTAASPVSSPGSAPIVREQDQSEAFKVRIITARTKLKLMRDRSDALRDSLQRFRIKQQSANGA